jgi:hypothetical protein
MTITSRSTKKQMAARILELEQQVRQQSEPVQQPEPAVQQPTKVRRWSEVIPEALTTLGTKKLDDGTVAVLPLWVDSGKGLKALHAECKQGTEDNLKRALYQCVKVGLLLPNRSNQLISKATNDARTQYKLKGYRVAEYQAAWLKRHASWS